MKPSVSDFYMSIAGLFYKKVFYEKMSSEGEKFFKDITSIGVGTLIATTFSFAFNVLSGRILGPAEYGKFNLVQSIAMFLYIPMLMGLNTSMVKYNSEKKEFYRQQKIISTTYILVFGQILASILIFKFFELQILNIFSISKYSLNLSIVFAVFFVLYTLANETLRSLHEMETYAVLMPVFSIILLISFLYFVHIDRSSISIINSMYITYGITSLYILYSIRKYLKIRIDKAWISKLTKYSSYAVMGGVSSVLYLNIDKILINRYMQLEDVGIYRAYSYSFSAIIVMLISVFTIVFFPYASMCSNKRVLLKKIDRIVIYLLILGFPISVICGIIILNMYGENYPFNLKLVFLCGFTAICTSVDNLYGQMMNSIGVNGIRIVSFAAIAMTVVNIVLNILLIPIMGIEGAIIATIISFLVSILIQLSKRKYIYDFEASSSN